MKEIEFINEVKKFSTDALSDDAAIIDNQVITTDILVEGTHFTKELGFNRLGSRALAVNVSDIAAMGAIPKYYFVSLALPKEITKKDIIDFYDGMRGVADRYQLELKGGDLAGSDKIVVNVLVIGIKRKRFLSRTAVKLGDYVYTTGLLGKGRISNYQNRVIPRVEEGLYLSDSSLVTAATDISDGLAKSIYEMTVETPYQIKVDTIPVADKATEDDALYGGEDYELLFTSSKEIDFSFETHYVGRVVKKGQGSEFPLKGFNHFS